MVDPGAGAFVVVVWMAEDGEEIVSKTVRLEASQSDCVWVKLPGFLTTLVVEGAGVVVAPAPPVVEAAGLGTAVRPQPVAAVVTPSP